MVEPNTTALLLLVTGALLAASVLFSRASGRIGVPVVLIFLIIGVLAGEEGLLGIRFDNYEFAFRIGTAALVLILFDGGINTPRSSLQTGLRPALVLATFGVAGVAGTVALGAHLLGEIGSLSALCELAKCDLCCRRALGDDGLELCLLLRRPLERQVAYLFLHET